jgi:hypothetical protein
MKDGQKLTTILNYNMAEEMMITEVNGVYRYSKDPQLIDRIYLENRVFVPVENIFYEILSNGPVTFYPQNKSNFITLGADVGYGAKSRSVGLTQFRRFEFPDGMSMFGEVAHIELPSNVEIIPASVF